jgi:hypothetical protein
MATEAATTSAELQRYLKQTRLLDFGHPAIARLVSDRGWTSLPEYERIGRIYEFVQNEIAFGYNEADDIPATHVLAVGYGQCNTKGTLLMALLRKCGVPCRFHAFTIDKALQKGAIAGVAYQLAPPNIIHSWVEVRYEGRWVNLEGFIIDRRYLNSVQGRFPTAEGAFCGFAIATKNLKKPPIEWEGTDTYIQNEGINHDYGVFDTPDDFYDQHGANLSGLKQFAFKHLVRRLMNANIARIRSGKW